MVEMKKHIHFHSYSRLHLVWLFWGVPGGSAQLSAPELILEFPLPKSRPGSLEPIPICGRHLNFHEQPYPKTKEIAPQGLTYCCCVLDRVKGEMGRRVGPRGCPHKSLSVAHGPFVEVSLLALELTKRKANGSHSSADKFQDCTF